MGGVKRQLCRVGQYLRLRLVLLRQDNGVERRLANWSTALGCSVGAIIPDGLTVRARHGGKRTYQHGASRDYRSRRNAQRWTPNHRVCPFMP
jgi:hypothetical protein